jgi:hypothetical protein
MIIAIRAGALYAFIVFLIGFIFGTIRVLWLTPRLGETAAVVLEIPVMLTASWFVLSAHTWRAITEAAERVTCGIFGPPG